MQDEFVTGPDSELGFGLKCGSDGGSGLGVAGLDEAMPWLG